MHAEIRTWFVSEAYSSPRHRSQGTKRNGFNCGPCRKTVAYREERDYCPLKRENVFTHSSFERNAILPVHDLCDSQATNSLGIVRQKYRLIGVGTHICDALEKGLRNVRIQEEKG